MTSDGEVLLPLHAFDPVPVLVGSLILCRGCWSVVPRVYRRRHAQAHVDRGDPWPPPAPPAKELT